MNPPCEIREEDGWCERHQAHHVGRLRELALMHGPPGSEYRLLWDRMLRGEGGPAPAAGRRPCRHLGKPTGETIECTSCRGRVSLKVYGCAVHRWCLLGKKVQEYGCCATCNEYDDAEAPQFPEVTTRHLMYHVCPRPSKGTWQRNVMQIRKRLGLFNGRRLVAVATGRSFDPPEAVQELLGKDQAEWLIVPNQVSKREVMSFLPLLGQFRGAGGGEATFLAHSKGITHPVNPGVSVHLWTHIMYTVCLDYWPHVARVLAGHPTAGCFFKDGYCFDSAGRWHYSGNFWWVRNAELYKRDWRRVDDTWWGTESYLGLHFSPEEAGCLFHRGACPEMDLYRLPYLRGRVLGPYRQFVKEHEHERAVWPPAVAENRAGGRAEAEG